MADLIFNLIKLAFVAAVIICALYGYAFLVGDSDLLYKLDGYANRVLQPMGTSREELFFLLKQKLNKP